MTTIFIPVDVIIPAWKDVIVVSRNPLLSPMIIEQLKKICPSCQIDDDYSSGFILLISFLNNTTLKPFWLSDLPALLEHCPWNCSSISVCSGLDAIKNIEEFIGQCTGQPIIASKPGVVMNLTLTEAQVVVLFRDVVEVQMCVTITRSSAKTLTFPKLVRWKSCAPGIFEFVTFNYCYY